ncbi:unnamed protein product [Cunninghamella blakesleeana]
MRLNLFAIGATALCFFQQVTATIGQTNTGAVGQVNDHTTSPSSENFLPIKRDGDLLGGVKQLLEELLGDLNLTDGDLVGLDLGNLGNILNQILGGPVGDNASFNNLRKKMEPIFCKHGVSIKKVNDDEITKREDNEDDDECKPDSSYRPSAGLLESILSEVKSLLGNVLHGVVGENGLVAGENGLLTTVVKTVGCLVNELLGGELLGGGDGLAGGVLSNKRSLARRKLVKAAIAAKYGNI